MTYPRACPPRCCSRGPTSFRPSLLKAANANIGAPRGVPSITLTTSIGTTSNELAGCSAGPRRGAVPQVNAHLHPFSCGQTSRRQRQPARYTWHSTEGHPDGLQGIRRAGPAGYGDQLGPAPSSRPSRRTVLPTRYTNGIDSYPTLLDAQRASTPPSRASSTPPQKPPTSSTSTRCWG